MNAELPPFSPEEAEALFRQSALAPAGFQKLAPLVNHRRNPRERQHFVVHGTQPLGFLTIGSDLSLLQANTRLFADTYPSLAIRTLGQTRYKGYDFLLQEFFPGRPLLDVFASDPEGVVSILQQIDTLFKAALQSSDTKAAVTELDAFIQALSALPLWSEGDRAMLQDVLMPFLQRSLIADHPTRRVSNADFLSRNILCSPSGEIRIIDYESVTSTHFHGEDWVRFGYWDELPTPVATFVESRITNRPAWTVFLALRQFLLESRIHSERRFHLDALRWSAVIKASLSEAGFSSDSPYGWPAFANHGGKVGVQLFWETPASWSEASSQTRIVAPGFHELTFQTPATTISQLRLDPLDVAGRAVIRRVCVQDATTAATIFEAADRKSLDQLLPAGDAERPPSSSQQKNSLALTAKGNDPQLYLPRFDPAVSTSLRVIIALEVYPDEPAISPVSAAFAPPPLQGNVEQISADAVIGWAHDPHNPRESVLVNLLVDTTPVATVEAAAFRSDLRDAGLGDGRKAFYFNPRPFLGSEATVLSVVFARTGEVLPNGRKQISPGSQAPEPNWDLPRPYQAPVATRLARFQRETWPLLTVAIPVYNTDEPYLEKCVRSVITQSYPNWELLLVDDGSTSQDIPQRLQQLASEDTRIQLISLPKNQGISEATNAGICAARGSHVALLDHDDVLTPDALAEIAAVLLADPAVDIIYSDQDKMDEADGRSQPFHKPDWSPIYFLGVMYVGHLLVVRSELLRKVGGCDSRYNRIQDYELMLRLSETNPSIVHLPQILYHWRMLPGSIAQSSHAKGPVDELHRNAVQAHLDRRGLSARAASHPVLPHRVQLFPADKTTDPRLVSIIIPTKDAPEHITRCLDSIFAHTTHRHFEVIVVDNGTTDPTARAAFQKHPIQIVDYPQSFNFADAINRGAAQARGEVLVLLNNDTEILTPDWIQILLTHLDLPGVGAVGPLLLYPDGKVQHAGVALGLRGTCDHLLRGADPDADGYAGSLASAREVSALTAACLMLRRADFNALNGMETGYARIYQDADLCLRLGETGRGCVFVPNVRLYHHESISRGSGYDFVDRALFLDRWGEKIRRGDPFFHPNFTRNRHDYAVRPS